MPDMVGDLGDINKVKAMLHDLLDGATLFLVDSNGNWVIGAKLVLKPLPPKL